MQVLFFCKILLQCECFQGSMHRLMFCYFCFDFAIMRFGTIRRITRLQETHPALCSVGCAVALCICKRILAIGLRVKGMISLSIPFRFKNRIPGMPCSRRRSEACI
uniref:Uncharacterized protein n=1 Tax=Anopheles atroparvus TaxID=41427 RepID=A0AAG5CVV7_ANOAO